ncbi:S-layer homology domain-containing protein [Paenibacillus sp. DXFW5]|uniref:S-layer homology domain-containing protein n=1 Tax=Paenibacillus rhizolycopersici TaxID=2780073 RepID=A0ABS2H2V4_9BACL|nr:S-layer homology domain-containing protein [Paenibacillus rhizolycopersici]MBM6994131.1 S-layer homology domain-containing protein [Paenibacillus rhizolycopersici]
MYRRMRRCLFVVMILGLLLPGYITSRAFAASTTATIVLSKSSLKSGDTATVTITFSEPVTGVSLYNLSAPNATLDNLFTSNNIIYNATLTPNDDTYAPTNNITLNHTGTDSAQSGNYIVDTVQPTVTSMSVPANGTYAAGHTLSFTVHMSESVAVTGTPSIGVVIGGTSVKASYVSGTGSTELLFSYTVQAGQTDADGITIGALSLDGGSIKDSVGNDADRTLNSVGSTSGVLIDAIAPTISGYTLGAGNAYLDLTFSKGIYTESTGTGSVTPSDFRINFHRNGGGASAVSIDSIKRLDGGNLIGGETSIRVMLDITGIPDGNETLELVPADGLSLYDQAGNAVESTQSSGTVTLQDTRVPSINPTSASFDKFAGAVANKDVTTTLTLIGNTLTRITNRAVTLSEGTDYTVAGNVVTIKKSYLASQPTGTTYLTLTFSGGSTHTLAITMVDSTPTSTPTPSPTPSPTPTVPSPELPMINQNGVSLDPASIDITKASLTLQMTPKDGVAYLIIPASILTHLETKNAAFFFESKTPYGSYQIPVNLASLIPGLGDLLAKNNLQAEDISFKVTLTDKSGDKNMQSALATGLPYGKVLGTVVDFHIDIVNKKTGQMVGTADKFTKALTRVIPMPKDMVDMPVQWGAFRFNETTKHFEFVPAKKVQIEGTWYTLISSNSNSMYVVVENKTSFADVQKHWAKTFVELAAAKGLVDGMGGDKYDPNKAVTRAEFAAMLVRALGQGAPSGSTSPYDDVKSGTWYFEEIIKAKELGLLDFVHDESFKPDQPLTREEMSSMLAKVVEFEKLPLTKEFVNLDGYEDLGSMDAAHLEDVRLMVKLQIMTGTGPRSFSPKAETTRAQTAVVLIRMLQTLGMTN